MNLRCIFLALCFLQLTVTVCYSQIMGPSTVNPGATATYNCPDMFDEPGMYWQATNGTITNQNDFSATVQWSSTPGTGTIALRTSSTILASKTVTIAAPPSATITGPPEVCVNTPGYQFTTETGKTSYVWTPNGGTVTAGQGTYQATVTWTSTGSRSISVSYTTSGLTATGSRNVLVNALPATPTISGPLSACVNSAYQYTTQTGKSNYTWAVNGGTISSGQGTSQVNITWTSVGSRSVTVNYDDINGCRAATAGYRAVTVNARPTPTVTSGNTSVCTGSTGNLYNTQSGMSGYSWSVSGGTITSGQGTSQIAVTWGAAGSGQVNVHYTNSNGCQSQTPGTRSVTINAPPSSVVIMGPSSVCLNTSQAYTIPSGMTNYNWTANGGTIASGQGTYQATVTWNSTGSRSVSVTYTDATCNVTASKTVTVTPPPTPGITGEPEACVNTAGYIYTTQSGKSDYLWTASGGTVTAGPNTNQATITWTTTGNRTVSVSYRSTGCTTSATGSAPVFVNHLPVPTISGPPSACVGTGGHIYSTQTGMVEYDWVVNGGTITSEPNTNTITVTWNTVGSRSVSVNYKNSEGCKALVPVTKTVTVNPRPVPTIIGPATGCAQSTGNYYSTQAGMSGYNWSVTGGAITSGQGTSQVIVTWAGGAASLSVHYTNANGCPSETPGTRSITINDPVTPVIMGFGTVCENTSSTYTVYSEMTGYDWVVTGGTIADGESTEQITVDWGVDGTGTVGVSFTDDNGCPTADLGTRNITIADRQVPTISGLPTACINSPGYEYTTASGKTNYSWYVDGGTIVGDDDTNKITVTWNATGPGTVSVSYDDNTCIGLSKSITVPVYELPVPAINGTATEACENTGGHVYSTQPNMSDYTWTVNGGTITSGEHTNVITVTWGNAGSGSLNVSYTNSNSCPGTSFLPYNVTIYERPSPVISGPQSVCENTGGHVYSTTPGMTNYSWAVTGGTITSEDDTNEVTVLWGAHGQGTVTLSYTNANDCHAEVPTTYPVTKNERPTPVISGPDNVAAGTSAHTYVTATGMNNYVWTVNGGTIVSGQGSHQITVTWDLPGERSVAVNYTDANNCEAETPTPYPVLVNTTVFIQPYNYIMTTKMMEEGLPAPAGLADLAANENYAISVAYFDGLGRPMQTVSLGQSPMSNDIVLPVEYDNIGREAKKYLPYARTVRDGRYVPGAIAEQTGFYQQGGTVPADNAPFAQTIFESSPLNRVLKQGAPGEAWQPNTNPADYSDKAIKMEYGINQANEVLLWSYDPATHRVSAYNGSTPVYFPSATLFANTTFDEHNNRVIEYVDKQGRTVLKRVQAVAGSPSTTDANKDTNYASTYYIYDDVGNLVCVLQPEGVKTLSLYHTADATNQEKFLSNWAFRYKYDGRKRMIEKQVPGAHPVYMVYDDRDRLVLTQDGKQRSARMWSFTKYDHLNRPILTGIKDTSVTLTQAQMQAVVDAHYNKPGAQYSESFVGDVAGNIHGYSNNTYPIATRSAGNVHAYDYVTVTYYDNYGFREHWSDEHQYVNDNLSASAQGVTYTQPATAFTRTRGLVTGTRIKVLDGGIRGGYVWLNSVNYYDDRYRVIQTISENYQGGVDRTSNLYDFTGKVLKTKTTHATGLVTWKDLSRVAVAANKLFKTAASGTWDAGAVSSEKLPAGVDGWIEVTAPEASLSRMAGLSDQNTDNHHNSIDYAFHLNGSTLRVYESGSLKVTVPGGIIPSDRLRIIRTGSTIRYYRNNQLVYTSLTGSSSELMVDASFYNLNATILNVRASFATEANIVTRRFDYDHAGRLIHTWHQIDNEPEILLAHNEYNELGQLIDKKIHSTVANATDAKQSIDYRYNIRGWLTKMNETDLTNDDPGDPSDYFSFELGYNNDIGVGNQALYNGNISGMKWSSNLGLDAEKMKGYVYDYDPMNRITEATYKAGVGNIIALTWSAAAGNAFSEYGYTYDLNGNMKTLNRKGAGGSDMDILHYSYGGGFDQGNKLNYVTDSGIDTTGFRELNVPGYDYSYDTNGNLRWDKNKGGKDLLTNPDFQAGASGWTVSDAGSRLSFSASSLQVSPGTATATIAQQEIIQPNFRYLIFIELEHLSGSGSVNINVGGTDITASVSGLNTIPVYAGGGTSVTITPSTDFDGYIRSVQIKGYAVFEYNFLNLPERVTMGGDQYLMYYYDATGRKLTQELYNSDKTLLKRSDYTGEYFYENDTLKFINHEEGRVVMTGTEPEYQYHLKDHLGNVRLTFTTKDEIETTTATIETENASEEQSQFVNYEEAVVVNHQVFDHTSDGAANETYNAVRLVGGSTDEVYGLARSISVMPGDQLSMEVWAKYLDPDSENWNGAFEDFLVAYTSGTPPAGSTVDGGLAGSLGSAVFPYPGLLQRGTVDPVAPKAYLNWLVFDRDFNPIISESGYMQIPLAAKETGDNAPHHRLARPTPLTITKPGYVYIYLSNENETPVEVFFDDFTVVHTKSPVVQMDDYYPFGLAFNSYERENSARQDFKFNAKEEQTELGLGWLDYGARMYMADIGRWGVTDPLSDKGGQESWSPYAFSFNNPLRFVDPDGMMAGDTTKTAQVAPAQITSTAQSTVQAIKDDDPKGSQPAMCSTGVRNAFKELTGSDELTDMLANEIMDHLVAENSKPGGDFVEVTIDEAQEIANDGGIVIGGKKATGSGHVVMVVPGTESYSGNFAGNVPKVMDTGVNKRHSSRSLGSSWTATDAPSVKMYQYIGGAMNGGDLKPVSVTAPAAPNTGSSKLTSVTPIVQISKPTLK